MDARVKGNLIHVLHEEEVRSLVPERYKHIKFTFHSLQNRNWQTRSRS